MDIFNVIIYRLLQQQKITTLYPQVGVMEHPLAIINSSNFFWTLHIILIVCFYQSSKFGCINDHPIGNKINGL